MQGIPGREAPAWPSGPGMIREPPPQPCTPLPRDQHGSNASVGIMDTQGSQVTATKFWWVGDFTPCWVTLKPDILGVYRNASFLKNTESTMWEGLKYQSNADSSSGHRAVG